MSVDTDRDQWSAINKVRDKLTDHETDCAARHARIDEQFRAVDGRFDGVDRKLDELAGRRRGWLYIAGMIAGPLVAVVMSRWLG